MLTREHIIIDAYFHRHLVDLLFLMNFWYHALRLELINFANAPER